ncbi:MAG: type II secretion system protein, partial [Pseudomonadota bacterium]|nr:type II secretion system protein [Pseudomonadota bacterium]
TLIEMVLVIIIISVASVPLFRLFSRAASSLLINEKAQTATQLAQEHAEFLLAIRRSQDFLAPELSCNTSEVLSGNYAGYTRSTVITQAPGGPGCPGGASCKELVISVDEGGTSYAELTFLLVDY